MQPIWLRDTAIMAAILSGYNGTDQKWHTWFSIVPIVGRSTSNKDRIVALLKPDSCVSISRSTISLPGCPRIKHLCMSSSVFDRQVCKLSCFADTVITAYWASDMRHSANTGAIDLQPKIEVIAKWDSLLAIRHYINSFSNSNRH